MIFAACVFGFIYIYRVARYGTRGKISGGGGTVAGSAQGGEFAPDSGAKEA